MRYWYTVIFIVLGVFILMAVIIKVCGKKTPLVRSRRKRRRQTIQHGAEHGSRGIDNPTEVQVQSQEKVSALLFIYALNRPILNVKETV